MIRPLFTCTGQLQFLETKLFVRNHKTVLLQPGGNWLDFIFNKGKPLSFCSLWQVKSQKSQTCFWESSKKKKKGKSQKHKRKQVIPSCPRGRSQAHIAQATVIFIYHIKPVGQTEGWWMFLCSDDDYFCLCCIFIFNGDVAGSCSWLESPILCILHNQRQILLGSCVSNLVRGFKMLPLRIWSSAIFWPLHKGPGLMIRDPLCSLWVSRGLFYRMCYTSAWILQCCGLQAIALWN